MQTKPLRNYGIDVTQTSFKPIMAELGLDKSVNELTQAEKEILRYISTLRQAQNAMGDFANTIESPANQLKVLKQQFYEMQAAIGNLFIGAFAKILPYVNAIIMVIKELAKTIASFFGIQMKDYNTGVASYLDEYSDDLDGVAGSADKASGAIKALKRQTLGFDQINNITSPTPSSGSGSSGAGGGVLGEVDDKLLAALKGYKNGMENVKMEATKLRDKIMDILGFTKHINEETGEVYFTYNGWKATVKGVWNWFKELNPLAKAFTLIGLPAAFLSLYKAIKKIGDLTGINSVLKGTFNITKSLLTPAKNLTKSLLEFSTVAIKSNGGIKNLNGGLKLGIQSWREQEGIIKKGTNELNGFSGAIAGVKNVILGLGTATVGIKALSTSIENLSTEGTNLGNVLGTVGGTLTTVFGGVQAGAVFGPWGAAIGGIAGAITSLITAVVSWKTEMLQSIDTVNKHTKENLKYFDSLKQTREEQERLLRESLGMSNTHQKLLDELKKITDENGNVKEGYEKRAEFIVGTLADAYGSQMYYEDGVIRNYKEEIDKIDELINKEKARIKFKSYSERWAKNVEIESDTLDKLNDQTTALQTSEENLFDIRKQVNDYMNSDEASISKTIKLRKELDAAEKSYADTKQATNSAYKEYFETLLENDKYERMYVENTKGNYDEVNRIHDESREETIESLRNSMIQQSQTVEDLSGDVIDKWSALAVSSRKDYKKALDKVPKDVSGTIQVMTGNIISATPEVVSYFAMLGNKSEEEMKEKLSALPKDLQTEIIDKLKEKGAKVPQELQDGINSQPTPKVNIGFALPTSRELTNGLNSVLSGVSDALKISVRGNANGGVFANGRWQPVQAYANGGMPSSGQFFVAREAGPELVGKIGRHTAVMNNNQIVDSVKAGVYEAVSAAMSNSGGGAIEFYAHTDEGVVIDKINRITRQTGSCPLEI